MTTIPDSIIININTSIPGSQSIKFTPSMIDPKIDKDNNTVYFNPLVKLDKAVIAKVPEHLRVVEFFKKNYFTSLTNFHGLQKKKTLEEATESGYVDNNISILLGILFPVKGIIYINNEPYTIADVQWPKGDWKIDNTGINVPKFDASSSRMNNPYTLHKSQTINATDKLSKLPSSLLYGPNYIGPIVSTKPTSASGPIASTKAVSGPISQPPIKRMSQDVINSIHYSASENANQILRDLFGRPGKSGPNPSDLGFYRMVNDMYTQMPSNSRTEVNRTFNNTTNTKLFHSQNDYNLSKQAYLFTTESLNVYESVTNGDCYFDALQQAINLYNKNIDLFNDTLDNKIVYDYNNILYGSGDNLFTIASLRRIVAKTILQNQIDYRDSARIILPIINEHFSEAIKIGRAHV